MEFGILCYLCSSQFWLLLLLGVIAIRYIRSRKYNLPPRPYSWPIVGNMFAVEQKHSVRWLQKVAKDYGPVFRVSLGLYDAVFVNDMKHAHEAMVDRAKDFSGRPIGMAFDEASEKYQNVAFADADQPNWAARRKLLAIALRNFTSGRAYEARVARTFSKVIENLDEKADSGEAFDPKNFCKLFLYNQFAGLCFSKTYDMDDASFLRLIGDFESFNTIFAEFSITDFLPFSDYLPFDLPDRRRAKKSLDFAYEYFKFHIAEHQKNFTGKETSDLTFYIMKMMAEDETYGQITDVQQRQIITDVFSAGVDTSQMQFRWIIAFLAKYQDMQENVYQEILETMGPIDKDDEDFGVSSTDYKAKMPYSEAFLLEATRYGTVALAGLPRKTTNDTKLGEYDIPKGTDVIFNQWAINFAENGNNSPHEFRPERFLTEDGFLGPRPTNYMPFGLGRRACPGEGAARNTLWMTIIMLLRRYQVLPPKGEKFEVEDSGAFIFGEPVKYKIRLSYRKD